MNHLIKMLSNNRGELNVGDKTQFTLDEVNELFTKELNTAVDKAIHPKIDSIVQERLARNDKQYEGYEELKKFKADHETSVAADEKKNLEEKGRYEDAQKISDQKITDLSAVITNKETTISSMTIGNALTTEIVNQNGYLEETLAMLRSSAELKDGVVTIKGKDANNVDQSLSVLDGVKNFLEKRPHLIKAKAGGGAGTGGAGGAGAGGQAGNEGDDLTTLNNLLASQSLNNDIKGATETRTKIKALMVKDGKIISSGAIA